MTQANESQHQVPVGPDVSGEQSVDTISGATTELLEAQSASTPEAAKREKIVGAVAVGIALIVILVFALNS